MDEAETRRVLDEAVGIAKRQPGGTLATVHAEDGTPYVSFVLFHLRDDGSVLFGSGNSPQHTRNMQSTPEVSFLVDNREVIGAAHPDMNAFERVIIVGHVEAVGVDSPEYAGYLRELETKHQYAKVMTEMGKMYRIRPRRIILMKGLEPERHVVNFERPD